MSFLVFHLSLKPILRKFFQIVRFFKGFNKMQTAFWIFRGRVKFNLRNFQKWLQLLKFIVKMGFQWKIRKLRVIYCQNSIFLIKVNCVLFSFRVIMIFVYPFEFKYSSWNAPSPSLLFATVLSSNYHLILILRLQIVSRN